MKTFKQFQEQTTGSGGSPGQVYKPDKSVPAPTQPPEGFDEFRRKYGLPSRPQTKLAQQAPPPQKPAPDGTPLPLDLRGPGRKYFDLLKAPKPA